MGRYCFVALFCGVSFAEFVACALEACFVGLDRFGFVLLLGVVAKC